MSENRRTKRGFTLAEVLVTIAIIAIMAAVLLPALNSQLSKGDTSRISSDLTNIQSGIQAFVSDLRHFPRSTGQLSTGIVLPDSDATSVQFSVADSTAWKGPYLSRDILSNTGGRAAIDSVFTLTTNGDIRYLTVNFSPLSDAQFGNLELALDEGTDAGTSSTAGVVRYNSASSTVSFLAMPIQ